MIELGCPAGHKSKGRDRDNPETQGPAIQSIVWTAVFNTGQKMAEKLRCIKFEMLNDWNSEASYTFWNDKKRNKSLYIRKLMENAKSMTEELKVEWEVPASDDETCEEVDSIPTRVLLLYKQIERDGFIELETKEYRQINSSHETSEGETVYKTTDEQKHSEYSEEPSDLEPVKEKDLEKKYALLQLQYCTKI